VRKELAGKPGLKPQSVKVEKKDGQTHAYQRPTFDSVESPGQSHETGKAHGPRPERAAGEQPSGFSPGNAFSGEETEVPKGRLKGSVSRPFGTSEGLRAPDPRAEATGLLSLVLSGPGSAQHGLMRLPWLSPQPTGIKPAPR